MSIECSKLFQFVNYRSFGKQRQIKSKLSVNTWNLYRYSLVSH